jgi:hypothetical protein
MDWSAYVGVAQPASVSGSQQIVPQYIACKEDTINGTKEFSSCAGHQIHIR